MRPTTLTPDRLHGEIGVSMQEAAMLCQEVRARSDADRLTHDIEEMLDNAEEDGD